MLAFLCVVCVYSLCVNSAVNLLVTLLITCASGRPGHPRITIKRTDRQCEIRQACYRSNKSRNPFYWFGDISISRYGPQRITALQTKPRGGGIIAAKNGGRKKNPEGVKLFHQFFRDRKNYCSDKSINARRIFLFDWLDRQDFKRKRHTVSFCS